MPSILELPLGFSWPHPDRLWPRDVDATYLLLLESFDILHLYLDYGVADDFVAQFVARLKFFRNNLNMTITVLHMYCLVQMWIKNFTHSFNTLHAHIYQCFFELFNYALHPLYVIIIS